LAEWYYVNSISIFLKKIFKDKGFFPAMKKPSTLEPFLIDERKVTLDLMVFGVMQRLNGQKWLERN